MSKSTRSKNISKLIILALVLFVPGFLYILVNNMGSNEYLKLPVFGEKSLSGKMNRVMGREIPDTIFHQVKPLDLVDLNGNEVPFLKSDTVISVVHLFYSRDSALSKQLIHDLSSIAERFKDNPKVRLYSISVDPRDTKADLERQVLPYKKIGNRNWFVVFKPKEDILNYAREELLIEGMVNPADSSRYIIGSNFVLLDSKRRIRGIYDISLKTETARLEDEIKVQLVEEIRNNPLKVERK